jgi:hypothetical protein
LARVFRPAATLEIRETENGFRIAERDRDARQVLIVNQKPESKIAPDVFYRDGKKLVEVAPLGPKRRLRETYEVSNDGRTLTVISRMEADGGRERTVEFKRVYQRTRKEGTNP